MWSGHVSLAPRSQNPCSVVTKFLFHSHKILVPRQQIPHGTDKNYFRALEIYFISLEIYFSTFEIYFRATEKVLLRGAGNFMVSSGELYGSHLRFSWLVQGEIMACLGEVCEVCWRSSAIEKKGCKPDVSDLQPLLRLAVAYSCRRAGAGRTLAIPRRPRCTSRCFPSSGPGCRPP